MKASFVWVDPERMGGTPCFRRTRVPVSTLFDYLEGGHDLDTFLDHFPTVKRDQALAAIKSAGRELVKRHAFVAA
ncbi:MAG TPA: DUF433 domain-containing protein [Verrucomicrobiae bacterium]|jgi:uncharacterized protein (DUF433 family)